MLPVKGVTRGINYGSDKVRFTNMVRVGKRVRLRQKLIGAEPKAGGMQIKNHCTIEIEGEERPACVAETMSVLYGADVRLRRLIGRVRGATDQAGASRRRGCGQRLASGGWHGGAGRRAATASRGRSGRR